MGCNNSTPSKPPEVDVPTSFLKSDVALKMLYPIDEELLKQQNNGESTKQDFEAPNQTFIVLDWDDTVFPRTVLEAEKANGFSFAQPLSQQEKMSKEQIAKVEATLSEIDDIGEKFLQSCCSIGYVVMFTLCKRGWIEQTGKNFLPKTYKFLTGKNMTVVYAGDNNKEPKDEKLMAEDMKYRIQYFGLIKARAIYRETGSFYSKQGGPTEKWKNILSIGDSPIDRYGTLLSSQNYVEKNKSEGDSSKDSPLFECMKEGELIKCRTKVFQMIQDPTETQLTEQLKLLCEWLPKMASFDGSLDIRFEEVSDAAIQAVQQRIEGCKANQA